MLDLYNNIKRLREEKGLSQDRLAKLTGYTDRSSIAKIEKGQVDLQQSKIELFAAALGTTSHQLVGLDSNTNLASDDAKDENDSVTVHVLSHITPEASLESEKNVIGIEKITANLATTGSFFGLQIHGNSMEPKMSEGDIVIVRRQDDAESGDTVIAMANSSDAICRRLKKYAGGIMLLSTNMNYEPMIFSNEDIEARTVKLLGRVVELRAKL